MTADEIRAHAEQQIERARAQGLNVVLIRIGDVMAALPGRAELAAVCSALQTEKFETQARVKLLYASLFPYQGSNRELVFKVAP